MINNKDTQRLYRTIALLSVREWLYIVLVVIIGTLIAAFAPRGNPIDDQEVKSRKLIGQIYVVDTTNNGFRVSYATIDNVTQERFDEMRRRPSIRDSLQRLKRAAPIRFGNMLTVDIYDFADFAIRFDPEDIRIHNIFVFGSEKENLYIGENPRIENWAKYINPGTGQGLLYLSRENIYCNDSLRRKRRKVYRYFKCSGLNQFSEYDEHFSHFSEDERIY